MDEQGNPWPPVTCPAAVVVNYAGQLNSPFNGVQVQVESYQAEQGLFEVALCEPVTEGRKRYLVGDTVLCRPDELQSLNEYTKLYIQRWTEAQVEVYGDEVYNLRDDLDAQGIAVKAESVASWTHDQRAQVRRYVDSLNRLEDAVKPEVLR